MSRSWAPAAIRAAWWENEFDDDDFTMRFERRTDVDPAMRRHNAPTTRPQRQKQRSGRPAPRRSGR